MAKSKLNRAGNRRGMQPKKIRPLADRFWQKVNKNGHRDRCWLWTANTCGPYGTIKTGSPPRSILAHRASWEIHFGPIPRGLYVLHTCDTPSCVNPRHLFLGTQADNLADMVAKGRASRGPGLVGEQWGGSKLTTKQALAIKTSTQSVSFLAAKYGVTNDTCGRIRSGKTWAHLPKGNF